MNLGTLLEDAARGDQAAWNAIVDRFSGLVWATARAHRLSRDDASDVAQTTWLRLVENLDEADLFVVPDDDAVDRLLLEQERDGKLWRAFASLSERCKTLLRILMADEPPSYDEVGAALGMPVGAIGPTRMRCLDRLRRTAGVAELGA